MSIPTPSSHPPLKIRRKELNSIKMLSIQGRTLLLAMMLPSLIFSTMLASPSSIQSYSGNSIPLKKLRSIPRSTTSSKESSPSLEKGPSSVKVRIGKERGKWSQKHSIMRLSLLTLVTSFTLLTPLWTKSRQKLR